MRLCAALAGAHQPPSHHTAPLTLPTFLAPTSCRVAVEEGHFHQGKLVPGLARAEVNLHAMTAGVAMLSLYAWLVSLKQLLSQHGPGECGHTCRPRICCTSLPLAAVHAQCRPCSPHSTPPARPAAAMPVRLAIVTDRGKGSKEQGNLVVKEAVQASTALWEAPFK